MGNTIIFLLIGFVVGAIVTYYFMLSRGFAPKVETESHKTKEKNKQKVLGLFDSKDKVANDDVEKLLGVSDATAERYLDELEREGHIRQIGKTGKYTYYEKR